MELREKIFSIDSEEKFESVALEVFDFQLTHNPVYREFVTTLNLKAPKNINEIPFLPISFFKSHRVICDNKSVPALTFLSSGTSGENRSSHYVIDPKIYERSFETTYRIFFGNPEEQVIIALLPNYQEQGNSSLVYMVDKLIQQTHSKFSGFLLNEISSINENYQKAIQFGRKVVIIGVSYALLDLAEKNTDLSEAIIIETGGMKGKRRELSKEELHQEIIKGLKVSVVHSEYGMTELLSQAYSIDNGLFQTPPWMKVLLRDTNDPFDFVENGKTGGINVIDLANLYSCSFIATQDLGKEIDGKFSLLGRFDNSDIRGCNLMLE